MQSISSLPGALSFSHVTQRAGLVRADQPVLCIGHDLLPWVSDCPVLAHADTKPFDACPACDTVQRPPKEGQDRRFKMSVIDVPHLEDITTVDVSNFISAHVRSRGLAPKKAN